MYTVAIFSPFLISIHALREESDILLGIVPVQTITFQSTLSVRRATVLHHVVGGGIGISIHALREESDSSGYASKATSAISIHALREESDSRVGHVLSYIIDFNPRSP